VLNKEITNNRLCCGQDIAKARLEPRVDDVGVDDAGTLHPAFTPLLWPTATAVELLLVSLLVLLRLQQGPADHILASSVNTSSSRNKFNETEAVVHIFGFQIREQHLAD
jgi:hypothetical protein